MSESEKRLRLWISTFMDPARRKAGQDLYAALSAARDAALEDATHTGVRAVRAWMGGKGPLTACDEYVEREMRALKFSPATVLDAARVREVLLRLRGQVLVAGMGDVDSAARELGLSLDAEAPPKCPTYACAQPPGHASECDPVG